jgi:hypothetical protein
LGGEILSPYPAISIPLFSPSPRHPVLAVFSSLIVGSFSGETSWFPLILLKLLHIANQKFYAQVMYTCTIRIHTRRRIDTHTQHTHIYIHTPYLRDVTVPKMIDRGSRGHLSIIIPSHPAPAPAPSLVAAPATSCLLLAMPFPLSLSEREPTCPSHLASHPLCPTIAPSLTHFVVLCFLPRNIDI